MKTITVRLPEHLVAEIEAESRDRKMTKSDVVRERLQRADGGARPRSASLDAIADLIGSVDRLPADLSAQETIPEDHGLWPETSSLTRASWWRCSVAAIRTTRGPWRMHRAYVPPWSTNEAVLSEAFHLLGAVGASALSGLLRRRALLVAFDLAQELQPVLTLMQKYANVPMSLADACLVRMTETRADPILLTTDADFRIYRRHSRQAIPVLMPS